MSCSGKEEKGNDIIWLKVFNAKLQSQILLKKVTKIKVKELKSWFFKKIQIKKCLEKRKRTLKSEK